MGRSAALRSFLARTLAVPVRGEIFIYSAAVASLLFLRAEGLHYGWNTIVYFFPRQFRRLPLLLAWGVGLQLVTTLLHRASLRAHIGAMLRLAWWIGWLRVWLAAFVLAYAYVWLKVSVPLVRTTELYDEVLWRLDRWLHFGISPSVFAVELVAGTPVARLLDGWYSLWILTFILMFAWAFATVREDKRRNFLLANGVLWTLGAVIYMVVPALGPCYASPDILGPVRDAIPDAVMAQKVLWANYIAMVRGREGVLEHFQPVLGIAAMPSLHVGSHWLFALWARRHEPRLFPFLALATGLTFLGSLVTAWHYAIDGYVGMLIAWLGVRLADRFEPVVSGDASHSGSATKP